MNKGPIRELRSIVDDSGGSYTNRILIGTACTGLLRVEWVNARYSQLIPMNWSQVSINEYLNSYFPLRYQVDDAQNLIVKACLENDFEWLFLLEHDVCIPDNTFMMLNEYMREGKYPVISGLYYSRSRPSEPLVFRGRGTGVYLDWKLGDLVWCDGVPTGCLLIHHSILKMMWEESAEYMVRRANGSMIITRRVFETPRHLWYDPASGNHNMTSGTSDLDWCTRVMEGGYFEKAGWKDFCPDPRWPFLVDTRMFCRHINPNGEVFP